MTRIGALLRKPPAPVLQPKAESVSPDDVVRESERSRRVISVTSGSPISAVPPPTPIDEPDETSIRPSDLDMEGPLVAQIRALLGKA